MLSFLINGQPTNLALGSAVSLRPSELFRNAFDPLLEKILADTNSGMPWREAASRHLSETNPWLLRTLIDPSRSRWIEQYPPRPNSLVLDVGCSCGQLAVPSAAYGHVVALEPNPVRLALALAIAKQEARSDSLFFVGAPLESVDFLQQKFDAIYCIGVLEWAPRYQPEAEPIAAQSNLLRRLHGLLAEEGECIIGIENRLGLKYLLGARDDHTGLAGISCLDSATAAQRYQARTGKPLRVFTHSLGEYAGLLAGVGFGRVDFFAAYPDYKVPQAIVSIADGAANRHCLTGPFIPEHDGNTGGALSCQGELASHYRSLAELGVAGLFAPSFFIRAQRT